MAELFEIYDTSGAHIGAIPISPRDLAILHSGIAVTISFHTPRMLREAIANASGAFEVVEIDRKLIALNAEIVKQYITMQEQIAAAMKDPSKWIDPDAKSDDPVR